MIHTIHTRAAYLLRQRRVAVPHAQVADLGAVLAEGLEQRGAEGEAREVQLLEAVVYFGGVGVEEGLMIYLCGCESGGGPSRSFLPAHITIPLRTNI